MFIMLVFTIVLGAPLKSWPHGDIQIWSSLFTKRHGSKNKKTSKYILYNMFIIIIKKIHEKIRPQRHTATYSTADPISFQHSECVNAPLNCRWRVWLELCWWSFWRVAVKVRAQLATTTTNHWRSYCRNWRCSSRNLKRSWWWNCVACSSSSPADLDNFRQRMMHAGSVSTSFVRWRQQLKNGRVTLGRVSAFTSYGILKSRNPFSHAVSRGVARNFIWGGGIIFN